MYYLRNPYYNISKHTQFFRHYINQSEKNIPNIDKIKFLLNLHSKTTDDLTKLIIESILNNPSSIERIYFVDTDTYKRHIFEICEDNHEIKLKVLQNPSLYSNPRLVIPDKYNGVIFKYASYILTYSKKIFIYSKDIKTPC